MSQKKIREKKFAKQNKYYYFWNRKM